MSDIIGLIFSSVASFFMNPLLYLLILALFAYNAQRVRRERLSFRVKAYGMFNTIFASIIPSILVGLCGSIVLAVTGASLAPGVIVLLSLATAAVLLTCQQRLLSPAIAGGVTVIAAAVMPAFHTPYTFLNRWIEEIHSIDYVSFGLFLTVALLMESTLVFFWGTQQSSPRLIGNYRGGLVGAHEACQLWIAPLFLLVPVSGAIPSVGAWPFVSNGSSFSLALFPLGVGIAQLITYSMPRPAVRQSALWMLATAGVMAAFVGAALFLHQSIFIVLGGAVVLISRLALVWYHHHLRQTRPFYFLMPNRGLRVIGAVPHSLGKRMGIVPGEEILRVNDLEVSSVSEFYEALQKHGAYCKLEVFDRFGEQRFVKGAIHENDNFKIGLLFLERDEWNMQAKDK